MILLNRHQIFSLDLYLPLKTNHFFSSFFVDSSFYRLESLLLNRLDPDLLMSVLLKLPSLPRLFSLTIDMLNVLNDLADIYQIFFTLPILKYYKFSIGNIDLSISLPISTNKQYSTIEHLVIDHSCTFSQLFSILSYTPQLCHLNFMNMDINDSIVGISND
jgi:hypothetical protein